MAPVVADTTRTPSISTTDWLLLVPRMNSEDWRPSPPLLANSMPASRDNSSGRLVGPALAISSRVITDTSRVRLAACTGVRVAVTTVSATSVAGAPAKAEPMASDTPPATKRKTDWDT